MQNSEVFIASQRAVLVLLLTIAVAFASAAISSDGVKTIIYVLLGILFLIAVLLRLYRRVLDSLYRMGGRKLASFFAVFFPIVGLMIFAFYPLIVSLVAQLGAAVRPDFALIAAIWGGLAITNLAVLVMNIVALRRHRAESGLHRPKNEL